MTHKGLISMAANWLRVEMDCPVGVAGFSTYVGESPDVIGFYDGGDSVVIECKISRTDFKTDKNKPCRWLDENGMGDYRYFAVSEYVLSEGDPIPKKWGVIVFDEDGNFSIEAEPTRFEKSRKDLEVSLMVAAIRCSRMTIGPGGERYFNIQKGSPKFLGKYKKYPRYKSFQDIILGYCVDDEDCYDFICTLCGNYGIIDTTGVKTSEGVEVGRRNYCICPYGDKAKRRDGV